MTSTREIKMPRKTDTTMSLRRDCYKLLVQTYDRRSRFYTQDCDDLWSHLLTRNTAQLQETFDRQTAIANVTQRELDQHCQF